MAIIAARTSAARSRVHTPAIAASPPSHSGPASGTLATVASVPTNAARATLAKLAIQRRRARLGSVASSLLSARIDAGRSRGSGASPRTTKACSQAGTPFELGGGRMWPSSTFACSSKNDAAMNGWTP